jgi:hypothetical protein
MTIQVGSTWICTDIDLEQHGLTGTVTEVHDHPDLNGDGEIEIEHENGTTATMKVRKFALRYEKLEDILTEEDNPLLKKTLEFDIPVNDDEQVEKYNKLYGVGSFITTEEAIHKMLYDIYCSVVDVMNEGGNFIGDGVKVKVDLEYDPENK